MPSKGKLNQALERVKGVDHYLDKQKKLRKAAEKKKRTKEVAKVESEPEEDEEEEVNGAASSLIDDEAEDSEEEESDAEGGSAPFDLERIDDTDSSSDGEDDLTEPKLPTIQKAKPVHGKSKNQRAREEEALKATAATNGDEDSEQGSEAEDIPLSDIESLDEEDREDVVPYQRLTINNISALQAAHKRIALDIPKLAFSVHQSVTTAEPVVIEDIDDDLNRELAFYSQSLSAVKEARILLKAEGNAFTRPVDYFAEMVKSDEHMGRVKAKLIDEAAGKKAAAEARKQRDLKKFGKQVQVAKGQERDKAKRDTLEKIKVLKRKRGDELPTTTHEPDLFDVELEDSAVTERKDREDRKRSGRPGAGGGRDAGNTKRRKKDEKYGFGGKKRFGKSGDAESSADMRGFSVKKMKAGDKKRPGKDKRAKGRA
ncbi:hypothetical protein BLS_004139 [Venturia inaequalis]|uniref:Ebp2-domain-containing protein n=1 Tax=Venturia inaequalis TaxID=5025 RepID=A0A8H3V9H4_VENIN|nr:hypothetical protein EG328_000231 [Venturia inaequalis]KAE9983557.1 hypothetical protein BLS_004139 [Venturia inaequalis]RDI87893.1 hypothetical protein Vi05172_g1863 [Venturia inaequalis]